jgi:hypothetical protein
MVNSRLTEFIDTQAEIDINHSNMTQQQFILKYGGATLPDEDEPIPDDGGVAMKEGTVIYANGLNFRNGPGTTYKDIGDLWLGDKVYGELDPVTNWIHFQKIVRVNGFVANVDGWASALSQYMKLVDVVPPKTTTPFTITFDGHKPFAGEAEKL